MNVKSSSRETFGLKCHKPFQDLKNAGCGVIFLRKPAGISSKTEDHKLNLIHRETKSEIIKYSWTKAIIFNLSLKGILRIT